MHEMQSSTTTDDSRHNNTKLGVRELKWCVDKYEMATYHTDFSFDCIIFLYCQKHPNEKSKMLAANISRHTKTLKCNSFFLKLDNSDKAICKKSATLKGLLDKQQT